MSVGDGGINVKGMAVDVGLEVGVKSIRVGLVEGRGELAKIKVGSMVIGFATQEVKYHNVTKTKPVKINLSLE
jgi:hypothetical protein